jgi:predicted ATP-grasp superfamily ATP-dependent carboligase
MATGAGTQRVTERARPQRLGWPLGLVMGDVDLVRALGLAGIPVAFFGFPDASARFSRHVHTVLPWIDHWSRQDELLAALLRFGSLHDEPPVLYPQTDAALLLVSRHRDELAAAFRFVLADAELIEQLVDKARFDELAERLGLPVPPAQRVLAGPDRPPPRLEVGFPAVVKPVVRAAAWNAIGEAAKALEVRDEREWEAVWPRLARLDIELLVQHLVPGPETAIESYHAYVDRDGAIAGEFTGRKIRTDPPHFGYSTAVRVVDLPDVAAVGRDVLGRLGLSGVAKADFKRDERGRLHLLEVNPRFTLWHYPAALAGVNVPALVHADLAGRPLPAGRRATRPITWCTPLSDLRAAHAAGISPGAWLRWAMRCDAFSGLSRDDPMPFVRGAVWQAAWRRARMAARRGRR